MKQLLIIPLFLLGQCAIAQTVQPVNLIQYVNPFIGTGAVDKNSLSGSNFPGATTPFGFVQLSPRYT